MWAVKPANFIGRLTNRLGEPVIRRAVARAMKILGGEFVLGETIDEAVRRGEKLFTKKQIYLQSTLKRPTDWSYR